MVRQKRILQKISFWAAVYNSRKSVPTSRQRWGVIKRIDGLTEKRLVVELCLFDDWLSPLTRNSRTQTFSFVSSYKPESVNGQKKMCPAEGSICPPGFKKRSRAKRNDSTWRYQHQRGKYAPILQLWTDHPLVQQHDSNGLRDDRIHLACSQDSLLYILVLNHTANYTDPVLEVRIRCAVIRRVDNLNSIS